jgi:agmatinase
MNHHKATFLSAGRRILHPDIVILGLPYDATSTGRKGADLAPNAIRIASDLIETYSPYLNRDLEDLKISDLGDMKLLSENVLEYIRKSALDCFQSHSKPVFLGGEHSITIPLVEAAKKVYPDLILMVLDAHADLREEYLNSKFNHACTIKRIAEIAGWNSLKLLGVRSGTRQEFTLMQKHSLRVSLLDHSLSSLIDFLKDKPVYLSLDIDVFDPSIVPGTGTPEPGGISYFQFLELCQRLKDLNLVGVDITELSPSLDPTGNSAVIAASCIRELMLLLGKSK